MLITLNLTSPACLGKKERKKLYCGKRGNTLLIMPLFIMHYKSSCNALIIPCNCTISWIIVITAIHSNTSIHCYTMHFKFGYNYLQQDIKYRMHIMNNYNALYPLITFIMHYTCCRKSQYKKMYTVCVCVCMIMHILNIKVIFIVQPWFKLNKNICITFFF